MIESSLSYPNILQIPAKQIDVGDTQTRMYRMFLFIPVWASEENILAILAGIEWDLSGFPISDRKENWVEQCAL